MIKKIILFLLSLVVIFFVGVFLFTKQIIGFLGDYLPNNFIKDVISIKQDFDDFITNFDIEKKYSETKNQALEIKQNISSGVIETQQKIENVQNSVDKTTKSVNETVKSIDELQQNIKNVVE